MKTALIVIAVLFAAYCTTAFVTWEVNPAEWGAITRFVAAWMGLCMAPLIAMGG